MTEKDDHVYGFNSRTLHAGQQPDPATHARAVPIYQTTSFVFEDTEDAAALFNLQKFGNIYTRIMNPTTGVFEERMASLEGGVGALATGSGQAAQFIGLASLLEAGDEIVAAKTLYGGTYTQLDVSFRRLGIQTTFVDPDNPEDFRRSITPRTRVVYGETIGNPRMNVLDIGAVAALAHENDLPLMSRHGCPLPKHLEHHEPVDGNVYVPGFVVCSKPVASQLGQDLVTVDHPRLGTHRAPPSAAPLPSRQRRKLNLAPPPPTPCDTPSSGSRSPSARSFLWRRSCSISPRPWRCGARGGRSA